jgi:hypothetical protein
VHEISKGAPLSTSAGNQNQIDTLTLFFKHAILWSHHAAHGLISLGSESCDEYKWHFYCPSLGFIVSNLTSFSQNLEFEPQVDFDFDFQGGYLT